MSAVDDYLASLPDDRRAAIATLRDVINANLPKGYEEGIQYGMPTWFIPLSRYPITYNGQPLALVSLGSQTGHMALYLTAVYQSPDLDGWFRKEFAARGKKLDMGKSCVRFKKIDQIPVELIGETIAKVSVDDFITRYEAVKGLSGAAKEATAGKKPAMKTKMSAAKAKAKRAANASSK